MKRLLILLPILFVAALEAAPSFSAAALTSYLQQAVARGDVPGVVVAVVSVTGRGSAPSVQP